MCNYICCLATNMLHTYICLNSLSHTHVCIQNHYYEFIQSFLLVIWAANRGSFNIKELMNPLLKEVDDTHILMKLHNNSCKNPKFPEPKEVNILNIPTQTMYIGNDKYLMWRVVGFPIENNKKHKLQNCMHRQRCFSFFLHYLFFYRLLLDQS